MIWGFTGWLFFRVCSRDPYAQVWAVRFQLEKQLTDYQQNTSSFEYRTPDELLR